MRWRLDPREDDIIEESVQNISRALCKLTDCFTFSKRRASDNASHNSSRGKVIVFKGATLDLAHNKCVSYVFLVDFTLTYTAVPYPC
jgi:hypothetical protein